MENKTKYIKGLDGLRALAVVMVLAYHLKTSNCQERFIRSDCFFCTVRFFDNENINYRD